MPHASSGAAKRVRKHGRMMPRKSCAACSIWSRLLSSGDRRSPKRCACMHVFYACMYCMHACIYVCMYVRADVCMYCMRNIRGCVHTCTHARTHTHIQTHPICYIYMHPSIHPHPHPLTPIPTRRAGWQRASGRVSWMPRASVVPYVCCCCLTAGAAPGAGPGAVWECARRACRLSRSWYQRLAHACLRSAWSCRCWMLA